MSRAFIHAQDQSLSFRLPDNSIGVIISQTTKAVLGTGFAIKVNESNPLVLTCAHVAMADEYSCQIAGQSTAIELESVVSVPSQDLSILKPGHDIPTTGLTFGEGKRLRTGDLIVYIGYKAGENVLEVDKSTILSTGTGLSAFSGVSDYLEYAGEAKPDYSGGPVFNSKGEVVAIVTEAWSRRGFHPNSSTVNINRAILTTAARLLTNEAVQIRHQTPGTIH